MPMVGTREINNQEVEIHASQHGTWSIRLPKEVEQDSARAHLASDGDSLEKAVNKARLEIKKREVKVNVPFKTLDGRPGVASGRHARSRDKILTQIAGHKEQVSQYQTVLKPDTPKDQIDHLKELDDEGKRIEREKKALLKEWSFKLDTAVDTAIRDAVEAASA